MIQLPEFFRKFFKRARKECLLAEDNYDEAEIWLAKQLGIGSTEKIILSDKNEVVDYLSQESTVDHFRHGPSSKVKRNQQEGIPTFGLADDSDPRLIFNYSVWKNLKIDDKYRAINWYMKTIIKQNSDVFSDENSPTLRLIPKSNSNKYYVFYDVIANNIFFHPDYVSKESKGMDILCDINHELQHAKDKVLIDRSIDELIDVFYGGGLPEYDLPECSEEYALYLRRNLALIQLPISENETFTNPNTNEEIKITPQLSKKIKHAQCQFMSYNCERSENEDLKYLTPSQLITELLQRKLYWVSEKERNAYTQSYQSAEVQRQYLISDNTFRITDEDKSVINYYKAINDRGVADTDLLSLVFNCNFEDILLKCNKSFFIMNNELDYYCNEKDEKEFVELLDSGAKRIKEDPTLRREVIDACSNSSIIPSR